jgi:hypothetical protein
MRASTARIRELIAVVENGIEPLSDKNSKYIAACLRELLAYRTSTINIQKVSKAGACG